MSAIRAAASPGIGGAVRASAVVPPPLSCFARLSKAPLRAAARGFRQGAMTGDIEGIGSAVTAGLAARAVEPRHGGGKTRSEEHTSELQSLMRISYAVFCL